MEKITTDNSQDTKTESSLKKTESEDESEDEIFFAADEVFETKANSITDRSESSVCEEEVKEERMEGSEKTEKTPKVEQEPENKTEAQVHKECIQEDGSKDALETGLRAASEPGSPKPTTHHLQQVTEQMRTSMQVPEGQNMADFIHPPSPGAEPTPSISLDEMEKQDLDEAQDLDNTTVKKELAGSIPLLNIQFDRVRPNVHTPRAQEEFDKDMMKGIHLFFNNQFSEAKNLFQSKAKEDPLYALGLSSMAFVRAISSYNPKDVENALASLTETYLYAGAQVDSFAAQKPVMDKVSNYFTNLMGTNPTHLPTNTRALNKWELEGLIFMPNGALRAHIIKAESALLMAMTYISMETMVGYLKAGWNLRRAYTSYSFVWKEYKRMGQKFNKHIDQNTVSGIQFGIGAVHLLLSSLPPKVLKIVSAFGWTADKHLGFALLKLCLEGKQTRSPLASLVLLSYYVLLTSCAPQILTRELIQPAIECLIDAQEHYPSSALFLFFAGRVSRLARNLPLSTQSFVYMDQVTHTDWPELGHLGTFEIAFNQAMGLDWSSAAVRILELQTKYNSPVLLKYFYGACMEMIGNRTDTILAFAESPSLVDKKRNSQVEQFITHRVGFFEISGYQDLDFSLPAFEILYLWNAFPCMSAEALEKSLICVEDTLSLIYDREKMEYDLRKVELVPSVAKPDYHDQRGILLLIKAALLNASSRFEESITHLNWIIDNKERFKHTNWLVPFAYWECGNTCWGTKDYQRARSLWETTLTFSGYDFEYRLATRLNLVIQHSIELGVPETLKKKSSLGKTTYGRKRLTVARYNTTQKS
ncbi:hypothetical protein BY458DRAFT_508748 [Sporodiniella umbellata]|nr:hypothetical protein BY458DRAFT_508748 [Sporodiniella umbellata]